MEILYLLIPLGVVLTALALWALFWAIRNGQYDDLEGPAYRILMDDEPAAGVPTGAPTDTGPEPEKTRPTPGTP